jgi:hypothetical protein
MIMSSQSPHAVILDIAILLIILGVMMALASLEIGPDEH